MKPPKTKKTAEVHATTSGGQSLAPTLKYTRPTVNLVALHEVEQLYSEDLFFDIGSLILGPVLGVVIEHYFSGTLKDDVALILLGIVSLLFLAYHVFRLVLKKVRANDLKKKAIGVPYDIPDSYTSL